MNYDRWTNVEDGLPWTDEEVLCKINARDIEYIVCKYDCGHWMTYNYYIEDWERLLEDCEIIKWMHIHG